MVSGKQPEALKEKNHLTLLEITPQKRKSSGSSISLLRLGPWNVGKEVPPKSNEPDDGLGSVHEDCAMLFGAFDSI